MSIRSKFLIKWGNNLFKNNEPELAIPMFNRAIKADSRDLNAYIAKAGVLTRTGRPTEALETLDEAITANSDSKNVSVIIEMRQTISDFINENK